MEETTNRLIFGSENGGVTWINAKLGSDQTFCGDL